jgi:hypothetical protein
MEIRYFLMLRTKERRRRKKMIAQAEGVLIRIGADEIILWLRKNRKDAGSNNQQLGINIKKLMETLGGIAVEHVVTPYWDKDPNANHIGIYDLPQNSTQYEIGIDKMSALYAAINQW